MRLPTKEEVLSYMDVCKTIRPPKTHLGMMRLVAKYFHCKVKDIESILG